MKTIITWILGVVIAGSLAVMLITRLFAVQIGEVGFKSAVEEQVGANAVEDLGPGLHVITVGTGSPLPDPARAGPMTAVVADGRLFIVDAGSDSVRKLGQFRLPVGTVEAAFLTHFHSDHIDSLGELMLQRWVNGGRSDPLPVYGPDGVEQIVDGFSTAYRLDSGYRVAHHGEAVVPPSGFGGVAHPFELAESGGSVVYERDGLRVTAFAVAHDPIEPAVGYRFEFGGRSAVISGDTSFSEQVVREATGADLLVHDALNAEMVGIIAAQAEAEGMTRIAKIMHDIPDYHASPADAARAAKEAGVDMLVLSHIVPALPDPRLNAFFLKGTKNVWDGPVIVARDGDVFTLRTGEDGVDRGNLR